LIDLLGIFDEEHMKFSTVEIRPGGDKRDKWEVSFYDLDCDRVNEGHGPHDLGFYHYPRRMGQVKAFESLRDHLVAKHEDEIAALTKSLGKLKALKMPNAELKGAAQQRPL
jgi:hypothetical protein